MQIILIIFANTDGSVVHRNWCNYAKYVVPPRSAYILYILAYSLACVGIIQKRSTRPKHQRQHLKLPPSRKLFSSFLLRSVLPCYLLRSNSIFFLSFDSLINFAHNIENSSNFFPLKFCSPSASILIYSLSNQVEVVARCENYWLIYENEWEKWNWRRIK